MCGLLATTPALTITCVGRGSMAEKVEEIEVQTNSAARMSELGSAKSFSRFAAQAEWMSPVTMTGFLGRTVPSTLNSRCRAA